MRIKFLHVADLHLGYEQYNNPERFNDFSRAFMWLMEFAKKEQVDFVTVGGDTFHKRAVDPLAMLVAVTGFRILNCPIYAIEGNHEKAYYVGAESWTDFLGSLGAFHLLDGECFSATSHVVCGVKYAGSKIDERLTELIDKIPPHESQRPVITLAHAGVEDVIAHVDGISKHVVDSVTSASSGPLLLGHIHKPFETGFALNPGSPENGSSDEALCPVRGALLIEYIHVDNLGTFYTRTIVPPRRPFHRFDLDASGFVDPEQVYDAVKMIAVEDVSQAIVDVTISGEVPFDRTDIDTKYVQSLWPDALVCRVRNQTVPVGFGVAVQEEHSRADVERDVLEQIVRRDSRYRNEHEKWVKALLAAKGMALNDEPEGVLSYVEGLRQ